MSALLKNEINREERAVGAIMGVMVGDALGMGMQWYYNLSEKEAECGEWVTEYLDPSPERSDFFGNISKYRYNQGLRAGDTTQLGEIFALLLNAAATSGKDGFKTDFCAKLDSLFATLSGESLSGRYTDQMYIKARKSRLDGHEWGKGTATDETTADCAIYTVILAAMYSDPLELVTVAKDLLGMLMNDRFIVQNSIIFGLTVQALINGVPLLEISKHIKSLANQPKLRMILGAFDNFLTPGYGGTAVGGNAGIWPNPAVRVEPPKHVALLFGLDCQLTHVLPSAYYLVHRFPTDFENAVLSASNGGGQNVVRAASTGALSGAILGTSGIPSRYINGLKGGDDLLKLSLKVASLARKE